MLALVKLYNGTEVIGKVSVEQPTSITLEDPLQINYRLVATQPMPTVSVSRYMPFSLQQELTFEKKDLLHIVEPRPAMKQYYQHALDNYKSVIDSSIESELLEAAGCTTREELSYEEGEIDEAYAALLEKIPFKGPLN